MALCKCGCGEETLLAPRTRNERGYVKGQPMRYVAGHHARTEENIEKVRMMGRTYGATNAAKRRVMKQPTGPDSPHWKGDGAKYQAVHMWVRKHFRKAGHCENCGALGKTEWANVSGNYRRQRSDWLELCRSCHCKRDGLIANITRSGVRPRNRFSRPKD